MSYRACTALGVAFALAVGVCAAALARPPIQDPPSPDAVSGLLDLGRYHEAAELAARRVAALEQARGPRDPEIAPALDLLVESRRLAGLGADPDTRALAERSLAIRTSLRGAGHADTAASLIALAGALNASGDFERGINLCRQALTLREQTPAAPEVVIADTLDRLGFALRLASQFGQAREVLARAYRLKTALYDPDHIQVARTLEYQAAVELQLGSYALARTQLERALTIRQQRQPDHPDLADTFMLMGDLVWFEGRAHEAEPWFARATQLIERTLGRSHPARARALQYLAGTAITQGDLDRARALLEEALPVAIGSLGNRHPDVSGLLNDLAAAAYTQGDYVDARRLYRRSLDIVQSRASGSQLGAVTKLHNLALLSDQLGDQAEAIQLEQRALAIWQRELGAHHAYVGRALNALAGMHARAGRYAEAEALYRRALLVRERSLGADHPHVAITLAGLADVLVREGRTAQASTHLSRALAIWNQPGMVADHSLMRALGLRGTLESEAGRFADARATFDGALRRYEGLLGAMHPDVAEIRAKSAAVLAALGDADAGLVAANKAEAAGRDHLRLTMRDLSERAALGYAATRPKGLDQGISIVVSEPDRSATDTGSRATLDVGSVLNELIRSRGAVLDEMAARSRAVNTTDPEVVALHASLATARQRLANLTVRGPEGLPSGRYETLIDQARSRKEEAEQALAAKSAEFRAELQRRDIGLDAIRAALPTDATLIAYAKYDRRTLVAAPTPAPAVAPAPASASASNAAPAQTPTARSAPRAGAIATPAARPTATSSYVAFILRSSAPDVAVVPLGDAASIDALATRWRDEAGTGLLQPGRSLRAAERAYRRGGEALRRRVWDPLLPHLGDARRVFIVPDGALNLVSFAALPVGNAAYLVEEGPTLHYLSAERDLVRGDPPTRARDTLLAVGSPAFDDASRFRRPAGRPSTKPVPVPKPMAAPPTSTTTASDAATVETAAARPSGPAGMALRSTTRTDCGTFATMQFERLPASLVEAQEVARIWQEAGLASDGAADVLTRGAATESALKARAPGNRILHLATHGFFLGGACGPRAAGTRGVGRLARTSAAAVPVIDNPLLLSGLALAGVNHRARARLDEDDGILTAEEVTALNLSGVEWAVLSACDTGVGEVKAGEGVFGLRRAFQIAGAQTVIMSLWSVEDRSAMTWMRALYEGRLRKGLDTADAVRQASLTALSDRRARGESTHPFFWAAFVATGDWR